MPELPVASALPALKASLLANPAAILTADTGSGKTTWLPLQLLEETWLKGKKVIMLEPRRVAARAAATRLAFHLGEQPGKTIGYSVRFDSKVSRETRLEVVTEGILARRIVNDPELKDVGLLIFDEFHERHVETDLALALAIEAIKVFRPDLKILVMSATIDTAAISKFLRAELTPTENEIPVITSTGTNFPVQIFYHRDQVAPGNHAMAELCARKAIEAHAAHTGDILIFLPGAGEIFIAMHSIEQRRLKDTEVLPLYGELTAAEQDRVLAPAQPGKRRIIVATPIAESSLTVDGLTVVIDSGHVRQPALHAGTGMQYLETVPVTQDSAVQRAGRAGRLGPGVCYRMYAEADLKRRPKTRAPEILRTDLAEACIRTLAFGSSLRSLALMDMPSEAMLITAENLLHDLGCTDGKGALTDVGRKASAYPLPPRLSVMMAKAPSRDTALLAAMLSERDAMRTTGPYATDLEIRYQTLQRFVETGELPLTADRRGFEAMKRVFQHLQHSGPSGQSVANALLFAYPDRVAIKREPGSFLLRGGRGIVVEKSDWLADAEFIIAVDLSGGEKNAKLRLALAVSREQVEKRFVNEITTRTEIREVAGKPRAYEQRHLDAIVLGEKETALAAEQSHELLLSAVRATGLDKMLHEESLNLCRRVQILRRWGEDLADCSLKTLTETLEEWLAPFVQNMRAIGDLDAATLREAMRARVGYNNLRRIDAELPERLAVPSGSAHQIEYRDDGVALLAVRIQEVFGLSVHPKLAGGKLPVTFELLSPKRQPIATTADLPAFWKTTYAEVRKEMRGRYPKHFWPEDPLSMQGTTGTKKAFDRKQK